MSHFLKQLPTQRGDQQLFFYSYCSCSGTSFHVAVCCKDEEAAVYSLKSSKGKWKLQDRGACPGWLLNIEEELSNVIVAHEES